MTSPFSLPDLPRQLAGLIRQVPAGRVTTAGALAKALGNPIAARWVGYFLTHHEHSPACCCHRVVRAGGVLGGYPDGDAAEKMRRLRSEGVEVSDERVDLERCGFDAFRGTRSLERLARLQTEMAARIVLRAGRKMPKLVGGVDVSYISPTEGVAAYALVEVESGQLVWSHTVRRPVRFPYITSYLTFRELPLHLRLIEEVRAAGRLAEVVLVDGTGILHPRTAGIASHLGVAASISTVGVTKKLLCGRVDLTEQRPLESRPVLHEDRLVGVAIRPTAGSHRPIFVSPGHQVDMTFAEAVVRRLLCGRRLPEPLFWADRLSRDCAKNVLKGGFSAAKSRNVEPRSIERVDARGG